MRPLFSRIVLPASAALAPLALGLAAAVPPVSSPRPAPMTAAEARLAVSMLADFYRENLLETHVTYVTDGKPPAATMIRQLFARMTAQGWPAARWLSVNGKPLNPDNVPRDAFETTAARAVRRGETLIEQVGQGRYRAVAAVPFNGACLKCHWGEKPSDYFGAISFSVALKRGTVPGSKRTR